ncbi:hypothetical protein MalM14_40090 [Gimesia chilikensis]|nr:hypothetical protein MalM14_40090 [Gimesia chilikensis]
MEHAWSAKKALRKAAYCKMNLERIYCLWRRKEL